MKKKLLLYVLLIPTMSFAQFSPTIQAYFDLGMDKYKNKFYGANLIGDYAFTKSVKAGIGVGIGGADILYFTRVRDKKVLKKFGNLGLFLYLYM